MCLQYAAPVDRGTVYTVCSMSMQYVFTVCSTCRSGYRVCSKQHEYAVRVYSMQYAVPVDRGPYKVRLMVIIVTVRAANQREIRVG
jgi:hypothetical protein